VLRTPRYLGSIAELADAIVDIPINELPPFHRDLDAAIKLRDIAVHQALNAQATRGFLEEILDDEKIDKRRHPRNVWKTKGKPEWERRKAALDRIGTDQGESDAARG
jgi:hypothetical protein